MAQDRLEDEYRPHYEAWKENPGPATAGALLKQLDPVLKTALRTYAGGGAASPTLYGKARLLALDGLQRYDPGRAKLRTHMLVHLQGLRRHAAREPQIIGLPERVGLDLGKVRGAENELSDRLGRPPSTAELSDYTGINPDRIGYVRQARPGLAEGQLESLGDEGGPASGPAVQNTPRTNTMARYLYHDLDDHDRVIMEHTLGLYGKPVLPKGQIANMLGVSPAAVSQRAARIQKQLDQATDSNLFV